MERRFIIKHVKSSLFITSEEQLTSNENEAEAFEFITHANARATFLGLGLGEFEVINKNVLIEAGSHAA